MCLHCRCEYRSLWLDGPAYTVRMSDASSPSSKPFTRSLPIQEQVVMHFVTGGFSGATQVAVDLCNAAKTPNSGMRAVLVLRRKRNTDDKRLQDLQARGIDVHVVPGWSHTATVWALYRLCKQMKPDVLVAHGFSDREIGRMEQRLGKSQLTLEMVAVGVPSPPNPRDADLIDTLAGLSPACQKRLRDAGIRTVGELVREWTTLRLWHLHQFGHTYAGEVDTTLRNMGYRR